MKTGLPGLEHRFGLFQVRPAVHAFQQHHIDLLQQGVDGIDDLDVVFFPKRLGEAGEAVAAGRDVGTAAGKRRHHLDAGQVARRLGAVEQLRECDNVRGVQADDAGPERFGVVAGTGDRRQEHQE